jgi:hypothetical protein
MASTAVADVIVPKGGFSSYRQQRHGSGFASSTENERAASELYSGPKSKKVPIHDGMAGYDGTPKPSDNIMARAKRRGYPYVTVAS